MAQFDVYENLDVSSAAEYPYWLDIQHAFHSTLHTRLVVPLSKSCTHAMQSLEPLVNVKGKQLRVVIPEMVALPVTILGKRVDNLSDNRSEFINAVDFLITGF